MRTLALFLAPWMAAVAIMLSPRPLPATAQVQSIVVPSCVQPGANYSLSFQVRDDQYHNTCFKVAHSANTTAESTDDWVVTSAGINLASPSHNCSDTGQCVPQNDPSSWTTENYTLTAPSTGSSFYVLVVAKQDYLGDCNGEVVMASTAVTLGCLSPTITPTFSASPSFTPSPVVSPTPTFTQTSTRTVTPTFTCTSTMTPTVTQSSTATPRMQLTKTSDKSTATFGDTLTFSISWVNASASTVPMSVWDTVSSYLTYVGCDNGCTKTGSLVVWDLGTKGPGTSGTVKFWAVISGYPFWPLGTEGAVAWGGCRSAFALSLRPDEDGLSLN